MTEHVDRITPAQLTLEDSLRLTVGGQQRWASIIGLVRSGDLVVVTCAGVDTALALAAEVPVVVLRSSEAAETDDAELDDVMAGWYAGDVGSAGAAVSAHAELSRPGAPGAGTPGALERDPSLVGIYGGDLEALKDAFGPPATEADDLARARREAAQRELAGARVAAPQPGDPDTDEITEAVEARMAGWYAGDVEHLVATDLDQSAGSDPADR